MTPQQPVIKGLPEGLEFVEIGIAGDNDFELVDGIIHKGKRDLAASGVLVKPAAGWTFQPAARADVRTFTLVPGPPDTYMTVKGIETETIKATLIVAVTNQIDKDIALGCIEQLKKLPGFVSLTQG